MENKIVELSGKLAKAKQDLFAEIEQRKLADQKYRKAKAESEAATNAKYEFLANMSHEFRLPLNHIIGFTELLLSKKYGDLNNAQEEYLIDVLQSSNHLLYMLSDILDLIQVDSGKSKLDLTETNLASLFTNSLTAFKERAGKQRVELTQDLDGLPETAFLDKHKIRRVIHNLLSNAIKFTHKGGSVKLTARVKDLSPESGCNPVNSESQSDLDDVEADSQSKVDSCGSWLECSVEDSGIGIKPKDYNRIFNSFEQLDGSSEKHFQGIGLGLSLAKRFVEMHGGSIAVTSGGKDKGTIFNFAIPLQT